VRFGIIKGIYGNGSFWHLGEDLEVLLCHGAVGDDDLAAINPIDNVFVNILFDFESGIFIVVDISVFGIEKPLRYKNIDF
jgi:hypothetical protein